MTSNACSEQVQQTCDLFERCHTVLADIFPHEGIKAVGGSRIMLCDPLIGLLNNCFARIRTALEIQQNKEPWNSLTAIWTDASALLRRIENKMHNGRVDDLDEAVTLLYLTNGICWNYLSKSFAGTLTHNPDYVRVEPLPQLLKRCRKATQIGSDADVKFVAKMICSELNECLR